MKLLLDTQIYLWFLADSSSLSVLARERILAATEVFISAASIWEASIKAGNGKLQVDAEDLVEGILASGFVELPITAQHAALVRDLPQHHRDPFDRLLVAQAIHEPLRLLSTDRILREYSELVELV